MACPSGDANPTLTGAWGAVVSTSDLTATYATAATPASVIGDYAIVPTAVDSTPSTIGNYNVIPVNGKLTIGKRSEERRVGKEGRPQGGAHPSKKKKKGGLVRRARTST